MIKTNRFASFAKTTAFICTSVLVLGACSDKGSNATTKADGRRTAFEVSTDHALGSADAPVTVVEYASVACPHCAAWHETVWPDLQAKYVDTGKVRYIYREFPTGSISLATAGHLLANCAGDDNFYSMIGVQMKRQNQIFSAGRKVKDEYVALAKSAGMTEADFDACMSDQKQIDRLQAVADMGTNLGVTGTPTFFINGKKYNTNVVYTIEDFEKVLAPLLGEELPKEEAATDDKSENSEKAGN